MLRLSLALAIAAAGCSSAETRNPVAPRDTAGTDTTAGDTTGAVQKASVSVIVTLDANDSSVVRALGLASDRQLGGVTVVMQRSGSITSITAVTNSLGVATFGDVLPGTYAVSAVRLLTPEESAQLPPEDADVTALGGGVTAAVQAPTTSSALVLNAGRRGSLVISEINPTAPSAGGQFYKWANYLELYNNSDTTIYLDGKTVVKGLPGWTNSPNFPCANEEPYRMDSLGIWSAWTYRFPGAGREHPLGPGRTAVVATDAIDHSAIDPVLPNLSGADFEFRGASDADNPRVPDMLSIGTRDGGTQTGHGLIFYELQEVVAIAEFVDTATIPKQQPPSYTFQFARIPREKILDVLTTQAKYETTYPDCGPAVNPLFDRQQGVFLGPFDIETIQRKVAGVQPNGRKLLLRTKTSARDFEARAMTPGWIP